MEKPREIKKLDELTINRIAAGEIIQRPANALKELIENSLDAKATNIQIIVKEGGLRMLQIQDNGCGIRKKDFPILCERFTTSKLRQFEDLQTISTYGFRGEALASISHIAHLVITSKTSEEICAYRGEFTDGKLKEPPKPVAGNQGTIITIEDMFYNMKIRRKALRNATEEYQKICDIVSKYAVHNYKVGFSLKKYGENLDIKTQSSSSCEENIRIIYGSTISKELLPYKFQNDLPEFKVEGYVTNPNYSNKKYTFLLFINHRLVDCASLKKSLDQVYSTYLPKYCHPFIYLSLELDPTTMDVNVHPTKHEVHFLNEDQIIESICNSIEILILNSNKSRTFTAQAKLPTKVHIEPLSLKDKTLYPKDMVRTDCRTQKLDKFFGSPSSTQSNNSQKDEADVEERPISIDLNEEENKKLNEFIDNFESSPKQTEKNQNLNKTFLSKIVRVDTQLTSVLQLRQEVEDKNHEPLREIFAQHVFVGPITPTKALIQHNTKLFLCDTQKLMEELFYQLILYNFENFDFITFSEPFSIKELALLAFDLDEIGWTPEDGDKNELANKVEEILCSNAEMLNEYFSLEIINGKLKSIPLLLENYHPEAGNLPVFIVRLATEVVWHKEKECFCTFARETALFYSKINEHLMFDKNDWKWGVEHIFYRALKDFFIPPESFCNNGSVLEVANLPNLYKVFERC